MAKKPTSRYKSEFDDRYSLVNRYLGKFDFEEKDEFDYSSYYDEEESGDEDYNHVVNPHQTILKYVKQIRESFGFDLDCCAPSWFNGGMVPIDLSKAKLKKDSVYDVVIEGGKFAIREINDETCGKSYEFVDVEKAVLAINFNWLLTVSAKEVDAVLNTTIQASLYRVPGEGFELDQWRIKPAAPVAVAATIPFYIYIYNL